MAQERPVFILGPGFNVDAAAEASQTSGAGYPMTGNLVKACFGLDRLPAGSSIEDLFSDAIDKGESKPLQILAELLFESDYQMGLPLSAGNSNEVNAYLSFLRRFPSADFLTFNYDSLLEILLFSLNRWRPDDGYGVPVKVTLLSDSPSLSALSKNLVLHLHGSLSVYTETLQFAQEPRQPIRMLRRRREPYFAFDPDAITLAFSPFDRVLPDIGYVYPDQRIIAPILNKAKELNLAFVDKVYARAGAIVREATQIVAIGYRFGIYDRPSYEPIIRAATVQQISVISPESGDICSRLRSEYPKIAWVPVSSTFADWVRAGYPI